MKNNPYDESLEWVPREYPAPQEDIGQQQRYAGHSGYPNGAAQQQQARPTQAMQQTYAGYQYQAADPIPYYAARQQQVRPTAGGVKASSQKMPKADALELLAALKKMIVVGSIIGFSVLSALVATHAVGNTANQSQSTPGGNSISPNYNNTTNNNGTNPSNNGGFFNQGGGNGFGSGGYSQPSSGTGVS